MRLKKTIIISASLLLALASSPARTEEPKGPLAAGVPVEVTADSLTYDKETNTYFAKGNVVIVQETRSLRSDAAMLDMDSGVATAAGGVEAVDEGGNVLKSESLHLDLREKTAIAARARLFYKLQNIHITGDPIKKIGPETYEGRKVTYTTCDCPEGKRPAWDFSASSARITFGEHLTGRNAVFHIKGVPVLYTPFIIVPVKKERQTGLLQPRPGYSRLRGFIYNQAFFWAISRNTDATFWLDYQGARGIGEAAEYRYIRTRRSSGEVYFHRFKEKDIDRVREFRKGVANLSRPKTANDTRWLLRLTHNELLENNVNIRANVNLISDDEYFIDFGKGNERSLESLESNVSVTKNWSSYSLSAQFRLFNNLLAENDNATLQRLPEVSLTGADRKIYGSPFYFSSESTFVNFWRKEGLKGLRLDAHPRISLPLKPGGYFDFTPSAGVRATLYNVENDAFKRDKGYRYADRYLYDLNLDVATTFVRVVQTGSPDGLTALRHTIRPRVVYTYIPQAVQGDLPNFDALDSIAAANTVTYSLNSILTGRLVRDGVKAYHNYVYLDLSQSYNINEATKRLSSPADKRRPFSEITGELTLRPAGWNSIIYKAKYDVYNRWFSSYDASLSASDSRGDSLNLSYRFVRAASSYFEASARAHIIKPLDLTYLKRFSINEGRSLETSYGLEYAHQCWGAALTYTQRLEERVVYLTFNLLGIGRIAGLQGRIEPL